MSKRFFLLATIFAFTAVAAGAFGAHTLRDRISPEHLAAFETGARYQMYHALALFVVAFVARNPAGPGGALAGWLFVAGIVLFSGSLYVVAITGVSTFGAITPIGGVAFLGGWVTLAWSAWRAPASSA